MRKATRWMVPIVPLVGLAMSITTSLSGVSRLHPPSEKQAGMLRVAEVTVLATREEILDLGVHYEHLLAAGISDSDLQDGSLAEGRTYCCGGPNEQGMAMWFYIPGDLEVEIGDVVEIRMGRRSRKADPGAVNTVTRVRHKSSEAEAECSWEPQDPGLWRRILHCEWMEEEGWKLQKGSHKTWLKADSAGAPD